MSDLSNASPNYLESHDSHGTHDKNVGDQERLLSIVGGVAIAYLGLKRGSIPGILAAAAGGAAVYRGVSGHCGFYKMFGVSSAKPASPEKYFKHGVHVESRITVGKPAAELYAYWRKFENLPTIMRHLNKVETLTDKTFRWTAKGPAGTSVSWDAEIINDEPGKVIAWRSLGGATVDNAGSVRFVEAPGDRGTEVSVVLDYIPPGRSVGKWVARLLGEEPQVQIDEDLRRFKQLMETGEITASYSNPANVSA